MPQGAMMKRWSNALMGEEVRAGHTTLARPWGPAFGTGGEAVASSGWEAGLSASSGEPSRAKMKPVDPRVLNAHLWSKAATLSALHASALQRALIDGRR